MSTRATKASEMEFKATIGSTIQERITTPVDNIVDTGVHREDEASARR